MRKYLVAAAMGAMLIAGQAAASESTLVGADDRSGGGSAGWVSQDGVWIGLAGALLLGLVIWGVSDKGHGHPISP